MSSLTVPQPRPFPFFPLGLAALGAIVALLLATLPLTRGIAPFEPSADIPASLAARPSSLPLSFVPNAGQSDPAVRFQARAMGGTLFFTPEEVMLALPPSPTTPRQPAAGSLPRSQRLRESAVLSAEVRRPSSVVRLRFESANPSPKIEGVEGLPGKANYFLGNDPARWRTNLPTYAGIIYQGLYPGIDLRYDGAGNSLKGTYLVAPGADPLRIRWRYEGAERVSIDPTTGDLRITHRSPSHGAGPGERVLVERAPVAWQAMEGEPIPVKARYVLLASEASTLHAPSSNLQSPVIGLTLGPYDRSQPLIIDPTLVYSSYLGGSGIEAASAIAVDDAGNVYVTGVTYSHDFPGPSTRPGGGDTHFGDVFVAKLNAAGDALIYTTYLGGSYLESGSVVAADGMGNAIVVGDTQSPDFPLERALQDENKGDAGGFVTKLSPTGDLVYSTYLGGTSSDYANAVALDAAGNAYVAGATASTDFPTARPLQATNKGESDAFVAKISADGSALLYATYLGGSHNEGASSLVLDDQGNMYLAGTTISTDFPTERAVQSELRGGPDCLAAKLSAAGDILLKSTYLGGTGLDGCGGIGVDSAGNMYVAGNTDSTDFPTLRPPQGSHQGDSDGFVAKIDAQAGILRYSTYLGGSLNDFLTGIAVDGAGTAYVTGGTSSDDFPVVRPLQGNLIGADVFVTQLNLAGDAFVYSTYLGGSSNERAYGIALDHAGRVHVAGYTTSTDFPTVDALQTNHGGGDDDAFVIELSFEQRLQLPLVRRSLLASQ